MGYKKFWIDFKLSDGSECHQITDVSMLKLGHPYKNVIEVIEKSALDELQQKLDIAVKALEFYASERSWEWPITGTEENSMIKYDDCGEVEDLCDTRGGKRARHALKEIED